ncbi:MULTISPECIES: 2-oxo-4-hydroxy-4-carboxy-5-ureidoimidazoline decarboxylase [unclassified Curtobacterium]|uniref:2-oxo-4-hydroxy-4-carboxy-5-ureidoimidazoline decarboxylase n=1 Tax=unclassified Curtobacterium TaxID=257496 RepID=UPI000D9A9861|nr:MULTISPECIES: 2-oxo-4-hydroxy-4-carboxy-5-ureidoimidazoline decarboxylase [unclassified Curtobacterium]PYY37455.1 2-oxo-4-hydroxy-4-carboxy-5-ureidoimidazoline decarboxylase [Curtobacterium sp. MCPF17_046]WIB14848.1 2-oxo-4-hydroxy-4-carboxy-5-ureidoimidazoline decarboxylase [Curtobacterium sp. MCPF17_050]
MTVPLSTPVVVHVFDRLDDADARALVTSWAAVPRWVEAVLAGRPFGTVGALTAAADRLARTWTDAEVEAALAEHPRIGDRPVGDGAAATASRLEQAASAGADVATAAALRQGNADYEARFDRVFLVRAAGRTADQVLAELRRRLGNDDDTERTEVADQLREIALLRLARSVA